MSKPWCPEIEIDLTGCAALPKTTEPTSLAESFEELGRALCADLEELRRRPIIQGLHAYLDDLVHGHLERFRTTTGMLELLPYQIDVDVDHGAVDIYIGRQRPILETLEGPVWRHDCSDCEYILTTFDGAQKVDVYRCPQHGWPTWIGRYGDEGPAYTSMQDAEMDSSPHGLHPLVDLLRLVRSGDYDSMGFMQSTPETRGLRISLGHAHLSHR